MVRFATLVVILFIAITMLRCGSSGSSALLDTSFGSSGKVTYDFVGSDDEARAVVVQPDGKIVAAGITNYNSSTDDFGIVRFTNSGVVDTTFGGGKVNIDFGGSGDTANSVALQSDGKIIVGGSAGNYVALARLSTNGSLDATFASSGKAVVAIGTQVDDLKAIAIQSDGKIVLAGSSKSGSQTNFALARLTTAGAIDSSFHSNGKYVLTFGSNDSVANSVLVDTNGRILAAGSAKSGTRNAFALVRVNSDGNLDTTFNGGGKTTFAVGLNTDDAAYGVTLDDQAHIVTAGVSTSNTTQNIAIARLSLLGVLDPTFNSVGKIVVSFDGGNSTARGLVTTGASGVITAGTATGKSDDFGISRLGFSGTLDGSLNGTGRETTDFASNIDQANAIARETDSKVVVAGKTFNGTDFDFALIRYKQ